MHVELNAVTVMLKLDADFFFFSFYGLDPLVCADSE
jgi:hypothetical protein